MPLMSLFEAQAKRQARPVVIVHAACKEPIRYWGNDYFYSFHIDATCLRPVEAS